MSKIKAMMIEAEERAALLRGTKEKETDTLACELAEAQRLMRWFIRRVDAGEVRSVRTYDAFTHFLKETT